MLEGVEAEAAFARARLANRALLARYEELIGFELVEVHPVLLGGDPDTIENKRAVDGQAHRELVAFWARHAPSANAFALAPAEPSPDYAWGRSDAGEGVHELPFIPLLSQRPSFVSPTLSGLLDVLEFERVA